jgi:two-component system, CitB family, sensor kinase
LVVVVVVRRRLPVAPTRLRPFANGMRWKLSLARQFLLLQVGIVLLVVCAVGAVSLAESDLSFRSEQSARLRSVAENLAANDTVRMGLGGAVWRDVLATRAESARSVAGTTYVLITDAEGRLLTGPDAGRSAALGTSNALSGRSWVGVVDDGTASLVAHVPVLSEGDGRVVGLVVVGQTYPTLGEQLRSATPNLLTYLLVGTMLGVIGSLLLARRIKRQTLGLEPREIVGLVEHREAMLRGIKEGVIGTDGGDRVTLVNDEAVRLLGLRTGSVGRSLHGQGIPTPLLEALTGRVTGPDQVVLRDDRVLVLNRMPVVVRGRPVGSVTTLRDRTELVELQRELDVSRNATDTLRAQAHEFTNRMHTIAGLIELGEYDEVVRYITRASAAHESLTRDVTSRIGDPALAALLIAKASLASEQNVELRVATTSTLESVDEGLASDLATVVGNLVDNALDALPAAGWVEVEVREDGDDIVVTVRDSGPGVAPELAQEVFRQGYTTKPSHGGLGLALTRLICVRRGGSIEVAGSAFTARIPLPVGPLSHRTPA